MWLEVLGVSLKKHVVDLDQVLHEETPVMGFHRRRPPTFRSLLQAMTRRCRRALHRGVDLTQADRYVKRYKSVELALALVCYFVLGIGSVRQLKERLDHDPRLRSHVRLNGISHSQLPKLLKARSSELWAPLIVELLSQLSGQRAPSALRLMDTSFFAMGVKLFSRIHGREYKPEAAGMELGMVIDPANSSPLRWDCRIGAGHDTLHVHALVPPDDDIAGLTYIFDRGFLKYDFWADLIERKAHFITRATCQLRHRMIAFKPLDPNHPEIIADEMVFMGARPDRTRLKMPLRRIVLVAENETIVFLSSRFDLSALEVTQLYRQRWQIEIFFRWIKRVIGCLKPLAYSQNAAEHTLYAAIVAYLLTLMIADIDTSDNTNRPVARIRRAITQIRARLYQKPTRQMLRNIGFI